MKNMYIGVDPGARGACVILLENNVVDVYRADHYESTIDCILDISNYLYHNEGEFNSYSCLENVWGMPGDAAVTANKLSRNVGQWESMLHIHTYHVKLVVPRTWQKHFGLQRDKDETKTAYKNRLKAYAKERFPDQAKSITLSDCDAYLIALYAKETNEEDM